MKKLKEFIFNSKNKQKIQFGGSLTLSIILSILILYDQDKPTRNNESYRTNINVIIPKNHVLFPFTAENYDEIDGVLGAYSLVKVYDPKNGLLLAENIKVLRSPKNQDQLAFLIPSQIANKFMEHGMDFSLALQKFTNKQPKFINRVKKNKSSVRKRVTYGV